MVSATISCHVLAYHITLIVKRAITGTRMPTGTCYYYKKIAACTFFRVAPRNRKHSSFILKCGRTRANDPVLEKATSTARSRRSCAGPHQPPIFIDSYIGDEHATETIGELNMPQIFDRLGMNAQDPLSSVHYFDFCIYVLLPAAFGLRMCFNCPNCNADTTEPGSDQGATPCKIWAVHLIIFLRMLIHAV